MCLNNIKESGVGEREIKEEIDSFFGTLIDLLVIKMNMTCYLQEEEKLNAEIKILGDLWNFYKNHLE